MNLSPKYYQLSSRVLLDELAPNHIAIVKRIKSRIIKKDALKIIDMANSIKEIEPHYKVSLVCYDNICSKSIGLLEENNISIKLVSE